MPKVIRWSGLVLLVLLILSLGCYLVWWMLPPESQSVFVRSLAFAILAICLLVMFVDIVFLLPTIGGAIYLPSGDLQIKTMLKLARIKRGERAVDIGSGDGRIVVALAKAGATAHGYEINPFLVWWSKWRMMQLPVSERGVIQLASLWQVNFSQYDVVTLFGMNYIMKSLETKLRRELRPGARVVSNSFPFPNWKPAHHQNNIYLYIK